MRDRDFVKLVIDRADRDSLPVDHRMRLEAEKLRAIIHELGTSNRPRVPSGDIVRLLSQWKLVEQLYRDHVAEPR